MIFVATITSKVIVGFFLNFKKKLVRFDILETLYRREEIEESSFILTLLASSCWFTRTLRNSLCFPKSLINTQFSWLCCPTYKLFLVLRILIVLLFQWLAWFSPHNLGQNIFQIRNLYILIFKSLDKISRNTPTTHNYWHIKSFTTSG